MASRTRQYHGTGRNLLRWMVLWRLHPIREVSLLHGWWVCVREALAIDSTPRVPIAIFERPDPDGGVRRFSGGRPQLSQRFGELRGEEVEETLGIRPGI